VTGAEEELGGAIPDCDNDLCTRKNGNEEKSGDVGSGEDILGRTLSLVYRLCNGS
jgi:hypothetical protein